MKQQLIGFIAIILITSPAVVFGETSAAAYAEASAPAPASKTSKTTPTPFPPYGGCCVSFDNYVYLGHLAAWECLAIAPTSCSSGYCCNNAVNCMNYFVSTCGGLVSMTTSNTANLKCCYDRLKIDLNNNCLSACSFNQYNCASCINLYMKNPMNTFLSCIQNKNGATSCGTGGTCGTQYTCTNP